MSSPMPPSPAETNLIGESAPFRAMLAHVSDLAPIDRPVLVIGERGTGKELVASRLALLSGRWNQPLLQLNCAALSESLLDSELFGHEAGAFTGAVRRRASRFELADRGTLFLDEIANASLAVQEKLLRVIEYGVFERVGGNEPVRVDVRVIAATHEDLPALAGSGKFRADLLDRLAFDVIRIPPLRERSEDILLLAEHFAQRMTAELGRDFFAGFAEPARDALLAHRWPGNVRELRNVVERSVYRQAEWQAPLEAVRIDPFGAAPEVEAAPGERETLAASLAEHRHNQRRTASALGLTYDQLRHRLRKHGLLTNRAG
ncbi:MULTISPECIES: sigma 54-interacting transcriptional regulator [Acidiphilium]|uniref:Sigma 54-interacting transcriptional regulator n=1 Tax=Acidiphilium iwatense TaxID=768198 RepID=A0ABS9DUG3_9PROT|nr:MULTISPECIES: sigma 54-interacting transcriptional regulator [Acidiphilium]MCF3945117.1 sigma 54-interacting transcriptional regulator [Acidiphilium iwatense]